MWLTLSSSSAGPHSGSIGSPCPPASRPAPHDGAGSQASGSRLFCLFCWCCGLRVSKTIRSPTTPGCRASAWPSGCWDWRWPFGLRVYLGRNWGMPMTRKADPELVTSGPYHKIRHPIYTGIILAMVGTTIAVSLYWLVAVFVIGAYFIYSAVVEERSMTQLFPDTYPAYKLVNQDADPVHLGGRSGQQLGRQDGELGSGPALWRTEGALYPSRRSRARRANR